MDSLPERIQDKIEVCPDRGCWLWQGEINRNGYGRLWMWGQRFMAHIFVFEWTKGKVPKGKILDHCCTTRNCCNPEHLDPVTHQVNTRRIRRRRVYVDDQGTLVRPRGKRDENTEGIKPAQA